MDDAVTLEEFSERLERLGDLAGIIKARSREITNPAEIALLRDPKTGKRVVQKRKTPSGIVVEFLPFTIGEARSYGAHNEGKPFAHWPIEDQVRLVNENVVAPDFSAPELADGPLTVEWVEANFDWLSWVEIGQEAVKGSRADFRVPSIEFDDDDLKKKVHAHPIDSDSHSPISSSMIEATDISERIDSSD